MPRAQLGLPVLPAQLARLDRLARLVLPALPVRLEQQAQRVLLAPQVPPAPLDLKGPLA